MILGDLGATIRGLLLAASPDMVMQTKLYLSCLVAGMLELTRCHRHQNYDPQLLGCSQGAIECLIWLSGTQGAQE